MPNKFVCLQALYNWGIVTIAIIRPYTLITLTVPALTKRLLYKGPTIKQTLQRVLPKYGTEIGYVSHYLKTHCRLLLQRNFITTLSFDCLVSRV